jgi:hypothetical protein
MKRFHGNKKTKQQKINPIKNPEGALGLRLCHCLPSVAQATAAAHDHH